MTEVIRDADSVVTYFGEHPVTIAPNGYHYVKPKGKRRLLHHVIAEETLGRELTKEERVYFGDKDRTNFDPKNIEVRKKAGGKENRIDYLKARIDGDVEELIDLLGIGGVSSFLSELLT